MEILDIGALQSKKQKNVDIVICIDATSSMGPCINNVRTNAKKFYQDITYVLKTKYNTEISSLRVQVIVFRDLECDQNAIEESKFFELPSDSLDFERYLNTITPRGGGDFKESGLEAIYTAMRTKWEAKNRQDRQIICLFTDADAIDFNEKRERIGYPNMFDEKKFLNQWNSNVGNENTLQNHAKRLVVYAPPNSVYERICKKMGCSFYNVVIPMKGMSDISFEAIIDMICASASSQS
ncbi:MAG: VWA domain-containing protein [Clostridia bacterium]|nr:VWA domain-containing protein [Clostridia bacterium]